MTDQTTIQAPADAHRVPGVYRAPDSRPFAVNVDTRESALDRLSPGLKDAVEIAPAASATQALTKTAAVQRATAATCRAIGEF